ncbi:hypothetical protein WN48_02134 [Eufriesea mexicana]|uniref:Uncharacterized protein n=1 Tax=Eufriesea mexicana TaxID=516756 RepID=A0A310SP44_9HYME|nr:hypothetical protein WN48_02134 [Eufriesea mexicana]
MLEIRSTLKYGGIKTDKLKVANDRVRESSITDSHGQRALTLEFLVRLCGVKEPTMRMEFETRSIFYVTFLRRGLWTCST